ncbi:hypothetical protein FLX08_12905 [Microbispora hainanensis]|uniref:Uncharacterized protein n=1 Tax=Microbispora hainanensis TaxID=568844 RepID=A0A544YW79_9ACTN|nr:hypothetical protein FLX08_12905 [Microbispora hainanensis]
MRDCKNNDSGPYPVVTPSDQLPGWAVLKIDNLTDVVFAGLSALVIEGVVDDLIRVMARTRDEPVPCQVCGALTDRVHGYASRTVTDVPADRRRVVVVSLQVRRLLCPDWGCPRRTFREQVPVNHSDLRGDSEASIICWRKGESRHDASPEEVPSRASRARGAHGL